MCNQLNEEQQHFFNFMMRYAIKCRLAEKYDELVPDAFHIFLSVDACVEKRFLVKTITEYLTKILKYHSQSLDQPSVLATSSTRKAATNVNGTTLHSAFHLLVKQGFYVQPGAKVLHILRSRYAYLRILLIDELSMTRLDNFNRLNKALQVIKQNTLLFGGISLLVIGDFLQLPTLKELHIFAERKKGTYKALFGFLWVKLETNL